MLIHSGSYTGKGATMIAVCQAGTAKSFKLSLPAATLQVAALIFLSGSAAEGALQSAITPGLLGGLGIGGQAASPVATPAVEGLLFVDPYRSRRDGAVYTSGPRATYDPATGDLRVFAPPMLGAADEFGVRARYRANSFSMGIEPERQFGRFRSPDVVSFYRAYERREWVYDPQTGYYTQVTIPPGPLSYEPTGVNHPTLNVNLDSTGGSLSLYVYGNSVTGFNALLPSILAPRMSGQELSALAMVEELALVDTNGSYAPLRSGELRLTYDLSGYGDNLPYRYVVAVPIGLRLVPEPAAWLLGGGVAIVAATMRRRRRGPPRG